LFQKISPSVAIGTALLPGRFFAVPFNPAAKQAWGQSGNQHLESTFEIDEQNKQYHLIMNNGHFKGIY
jgi:hypothetical protein